MPLRAVALALTGQGVLAVVVKLLLIGDVLRLGALVQVLQVFPARGAQALLNQDAPGLVGLIPLTLSAVARG